EWPARRFCGFGRKCGYWCSQRARNLHRGGFLRRGSWLPVSLEPVLWSTQTAGLRGDRGFGLRRLVVRDGNVAAVGARQREQDDSGASQGDGQEQDTALRPGGAAGEPGCAGRVGGEEMATDNEAAVRHAVEEGLGPVPRGV